MAPFVLIVVKNADATVEGVPSIDMYGPFPSERRAELYLEAMHKSGMTHKWIIKPMTVPYAVCKNIIYR